MKFKILLTSLLLLLFTACEQSEPQFNARNGDILTFAGREWEIKYGPAIMGPGANFFSDHPNDVFVDDKGYLHLSVVRRDNVWKCTEVISKDTMGYGTYIWTIQGNPVDIDRNIVLGLFTWDNNTFKEQANSEVDIEFAKWGFADTPYTLQYGVQPIAFGPYNSERVYKPLVNSSNWIGVSTHAFTWTDTLITWASWRGDAYGTRPPDAEWSFDLSNPARVKFENGLESDPIVIPAPGNTTNARMNLWLLEGPGGPFNQMPHEIIIQDFKYHPL
jgi:hypothetical protein